MPRLADEDPVFVARLLERGEGAVRADYEANATYGGDNRAKVRRWLNENADEREAKADARSERMTQAAEASASATKWATRAAFASALIALAAFVVSIIALVRTRP